MYPARACGGQRFFVDKASENHWTSPPNRALLFLMREPMRLAWDPPRGLPADAGLRWWRRWRRHHHRRIP